MWQEQKELGNIIGDEIERRSSPIYEAIRQEYVKNGQPIRGGFTRLGMVYDRLAGPIITAFVIIITPFLTRKTK
jgi:hypothetical protein